MTPPDRPVSARLEELRRLREAGTSGQWVPGYDFPYAINADLSVLVIDEGQLSEADAALIVAAVNALPALLDIASAAAAYMEPGDLADMDIDESIRLGEVLRAALDRLNTEDGAGR